jgi:hypothetical protein
MAKTNKFNVPNGIMNQGKVADIPEFPFFLSFIKIHNKNLFSRKRSVFVNNYLVQLIEHPIL